MTYEAVGVFGPRAASSALPVAAVADVGPETASVTLLRAHRLRHCGDRGRYPTVLRKHTLLVTLEMGVATQRLDVEPQSELDRS